MFKISALVVAILACPLVAAAQDFSRLSALTETRRVAGCAWR